MLLTTPRNVRAALVQARQRRQALWRQHSEFVCEWLCKEPGTCMDRLWYFLARIDTEMLKASHVAVKFRPRR